MELVDIWPLHGLSLRTPRLELRPVRDEDLPALAEAALAGIHEPDRMPFAVPWTDQSPADLPGHTARFVWGTRANSHPGAWTILFSVIEDGVPIGIQDVRAMNFATTRTIHSGSWITKSRQGRGIGTEMRAAILAFAFDRLGAEYAESGAATWNDASIGVSRKLGYRENGVHRFEVRPGELVEEIGFRVTAADFVRPGWTLEVSGFEAARALLGA
ncbi:N-acetyltransferase [Agromyces protaetiae]|uniref:N-acetyltransferase n=1 Tax=Agromyces protaetiae TaxID=2509455 RepID=A0A4P6F994_9MICO|nr:GNAT family protein [Agromyces protaetiae]QAY72155.1 N-acetyltransferase [Agromyces protaetiae]